MTLNYGLWGGSTISPAARAEGLWRIIQRWPLSLVLSRGGTDLEAQIVRIEHDNSSTVRDSAIGRVSVQGVKLYGIQDHPDPAILDTDIQTGDRFWLSGGSSQPDIEYEVRNVARLPGQIQAWAERIE